MNNRRSGASVFAETLASPCSDEQVRIMLDYFADEIDHKFQRNLVSELMARYVQVSQDLEVKTGELKRSDAVRREAQEIALLGNWELDIPTGNLSISDTMHKVLEIPGDVEPTLKSFLRYVHPDDAEFMRLTIDRVADGIVDPEYQYRMLKKDGSTMWVDVRCVLSRDAAGKPRKLLGTLQDVTESKLTVEKLREYNDRLEDMVSEKVAEISRAQMATIYALVTLAESRDDDTGEHIVRTSAYCRLLAEKLSRTEKYRYKMDISFVDDIEQASPLHDIGKVGIPDAILLKPGRLSPAEFEIMKTHTTIGYNTLLGVSEKCTTSDFIKMGMEIALGHHEKWDGSGYPCGLQGEDIPLSARIMAVADVYDALRSKRVYKDGYSHEMSVSMIVEKRGSHFDPQLVDIFLQNEYAFREIFDRASGETVG